MREVVRCSNCGNKLLKANDKCGECGYQRETNINPAAHLYRVILVSAGRNKRKVTFTAAQKIGVDLAEAKTIMSDLPVVIMETDNEAQAREIKDEFEKMGAMIEIQVDESFHDERYRELEPASPKWRFNWLTILILVLAFVTPFVNRWGDELKDFVGENFNIGRSSSDFEYIYVIAAKSDIESGEEIRLDMLKQLRIAREKAPKGAVAPLDVQQLIGVRVSGDIPAGSIIIFNN